MLELEQTHCELADAVSIWGLNIIILKIEFLKLWSEKVRVGNSLSDLNQFKKHITGDEEYKNLLPISIDASSGCFKFIKSSIKLLWIIETNNRIFILRVNNSTNWKREVRAINF